MNKAGLTGHLYGTDGVFPLPDSDSETDSETDSDKNGSDSNMQKCFHWTDSDTYACSDSDSNG